jgi:N6-adenosine-specific RNA methylase IME4
MIVSYSCGVLGLYYLRQYSWLVLGVLNIRPLGLSGKRLTELVKDVLGMGNYTRGNTEFCLMGVKGKPKRIDNNVSQLIKSTIRQHSKKPDIVRDKITQLCGDLPRIELFARTKVHGWDVWGNDEKLEATPLESFF